MGFYDMASVSKGASPVVAIYSLCSYAFTSLDKQINLFSLICPDQKKLKGKPINYYLVKLLFLRLHNNLSGRYLCIISLLIFNNLQGRLSGMFANMEAYWPKWNSLKRENSDLCFSVGLNWTKGFWTS